jgi:hypothetical protein
VRFAVHQPRRPGASPRRHSPSGHDVACRVHIRVARPSAGHAGEEGLALATLRCDVPADMAPLRRERSRGPLDPAWGLLFQARHNPAPALAKDAPIQAGLLPDSLPRPLDRALRALGHGPHVQVLDPDYVEAAGQVSRGLLHPVSAAVGRPSVQPCESPLYPRSSVGAPLAAGQSPLQQTKPTRLGRVQARRGQELPGRQGRRDGYAPVDSDDSAVPGCGDRGRDRGERDMPAANPITGHPVGCRHRDRAGPAEPHPAELRDLDCTPVAVQPPHIAWLHRHDPESLIDATLTPRRRAGRARVLLGRQPDDSRAPRSQRSDVVRPCLVEVTQRLLLDDDRTLGQPRERGPGVGELAALQGEPRRRPSTRLPPRPLLDRQVPHEAGARTVPKQDHLLGGHGIQPVAAHPRNLAATWDNHRADRTACLPGLKAGACFGGML